MSPVILDNLNVFRTEEQEPCTQDNPKKMNPNELTHYFRDALQFSTSGGSVEVKISSALPNQLAWHPYLSTLFFHFNLIENPFLLNNTELDEFYNAGKEENKQEFYLAQRRFQDGILQLNGPSPMGLSIREHALHLVANGLKKDKNFINQCLLNPGPDALVKLKNTIRKAAELKPATVADDTIFNQLQEYHLLIFTDKANLLEEVVLSLGKIKDELKEILEKIAVEKRENFMQQGKLAYLQFLSILGQWEEVKGLPESAWIGGNLKSKTQLLPEIKGFLQEITRFSSHFTPILGGWCSFTEIKSKQDVECYLGRIKEQLMDLSLICHQSADDYIKRINAGNTSDLNLKLWAEEVEKIILDINSKKVLKKNLETNTRNFYQFFLTLDLSHQKLHRALVFSKTYPDIMAWKAFSETLDAQSLQVIDALKNLPAAQWVEYYNQAAHQLFFESWLNPALIDDNEVIKNAGNSQMTKWILVAQADIKKLKGQGSEYEKENTSVFSKVGKWFNFSKSAEDKEKANPGIGQFIVTLSENMGNEINFKLQAEDGSSSNWFVEVEVIKGLSALIKIDKKIDDYAITDRFSVAKTVADVILDLNCEIRVFQLKSANILCLLPTALSNTLLRELDDLGIKEFQGRTSKQDALIESIIETRRKQILLLFNGLPVDQFSNSFEHQYLLLEKIQKLGFITHSVWASDIIAKGGGPCFEELRKVLIN